MPDPYQQRNPGPDPVDVPAIPATVAPGDSVSWPWPIAGFDPIPDPPAAAPKTAATTSKTSPPAEPAQPAARTDAAGQE